MKKTFFKIVAATLLIGGLAFNFAITTTISNNGLVSLKVISNNAIAECENDKYMTHDWTGCHCDYDPLFSCNCDY